MRCDEDGALELRQMYTIAPPWAFTTSMCTKLEY